MYLSNSARCCKALKKDLTNAAQINFNPSANEFAWKAIFPLIVWWIHTCILSNATRSSTYLNILPFDCFSCLKKAPLNSYLAIHLLSFNRSAKLWLFSFKNEPVSKRGPLSPEPFLMSQWMFKWNKRPLCSATISSQKAPN